MENKLIDFRPRTNREEILFQLLKHGSVSIMDFPYLSGFRTRVSEITKEGLNLRSENITDYNKFGNKFTYVKHILEGEKSFYICEKMLLCV